MKAEIITIGDEILIGQTVDTNSAFIGKELNAIGLSVNRITSISDTEQAIIQAISEAQLRVDLIILTGGLGPTKDDITKHTLCKYFNTELVVYPEVEQYVRDIFERRNRPILEVNLKQAELPLDCTVISNRIGTASGMWFERAGKVVVSLPGVPYEMKHLMHNGVLSKIQSTFKTPAVLHKTIMTTGAGESFLADKIQDWEKSLDQEDIHIAYLPSSGIVKIRLSIISEDRENAQERIDRKVMELLQIIPNYVYGFDDLPLEKAVGELLLKHQATISTAESCTGGYIAHLITSIAGSSAYFLGSVLSYANEVKSQELGVPMSTIEQHGAVSKQVVEQMAIGVRNKMKTSFSVATSGVAGPDGGSEEKPVGFVWIAVAFENGVVSKSFNFENDRGRNIQRASIAALNMLRLAINKELL